MNDSTCLNCDGNHYTLDGQCKESSQAREINRIIAYENVSYLEAKKRVLKTFPMAPHPSLGNFPNLQAHASQLFYAKVTNSNKLNPVFKQNLSQNERINQLSFQLSSILTGLPQTTHLVKDVLNTITSHLKKVNHGPIIHAGKEV